MENQLRCVSELNNRHAGTDIYILGTGASVRVFPLSFLSGKIVIGLNMAWKLFPVQYAITIRPELNIPEFMERESARPEIIWVTKYNKLTSDPQKKFVMENRDRFFMYRTDGKKNTAAPDQPSDVGRILDWVRNSSDNYLYLWSSISQSAVNLAANMGAKNIILVGCDNCSLFGNHHAHNQHTMWKGAEPNFRYRQYYEGLAEVRAALRARGVNLLSLTPFMSLEHPEEDFKCLCEELDKPLLIKNEDIKVKKPRLREYIRHYLLIGSKTFTKAGSFLKRLSCKS